MSSVASIRTYRIGEVAEIAGVTTRTIRYYEELGLLGPAGNRAKGTHRLYTDADVARITELVRLRDLLGLSLEELTAFAETGEARAALRGQYAETTSDEARLAIVEEATGLVERQLELVRGRQAKLDEFAGELSERLELLRQMHDELSG